MGTPHIGGTTEEPVPALVRAELDRILASELFARTERLSAFLRFIVEQSLSGQGHTLKEQVIAIELYGKGADFNTAADPIVRVDARRLRDRLREYYASAPAGPVTISVPKGSYTPVFARKARAPLTCPTGAARYRRLIATKYIHPSRLQPKARGVTGDHPGYCGFSLAASEYSFSSW
jgi:hypothetical protein